MIHGAGVAAAIVRGGGPSITEESIEYIQKNGHIPTGQCGYTNAGELSCDFVIHTVGPVYR